MRYYDTVAQTHKSVEGSNGALKTELSNVSIKTDLNTFNNAVSVVPSDTVNLISVSKGIYIGGAGNVSVVLSSGNAITLTVLSVGVIHNMAVSRVNLTGTTAANIVAFY